MPRLSPHGQRPDWNSLYELAAAQGGYFTLADAARAGFSAPLLHYHARVGRIERAGRGIFRLVNFPVTDEEDLVPVWLWSDRRGVFSHETALALHGLSDALPSRLHLTLPAPWSKRRLRAPQRVVLHFADLPKRETAWKGPVRVTNPLRTVRDCAAGAVPPDIVRQAVTQGVRRGLFTRDDVRAIRQGQRRHDRS